MKASCIVLYIHYIHIHTFISIHTCVCIYTVSFEHLHFVIYLQQLTGEIQNCYAMQKMAKLQNMLFCTYRHQKYKLCVLHVQGSKMRFLDTMSLHMAVSGLTGFQRTLWMANKLGKKRGLQEVKQHMQKMGWKKKEPGVSVSYGAFPPEGAGRFSPQRCGTGRVSTTKKWA